LETVRRVYHFINREHGLLALKRRRLKVAIFEELNDPFELLGVASRDLSIRLAYERTKRGLSQYSGLLCFSGNWRNPVLWSHYADHHRGLCLGFDISGEMMKVAYTHKRLQPDFTALKNGGDAALAHMRRVIATKFSHWRYEDEYRLFVKLDAQDDGGLYFADFSESIALKEVIVGSRSAITRSELGEALSGLTSNVVVRKGRLAFQSFKVVEQRKKALWE
jgi:hypothetical protein